MIETIHGRRVLRNILFGFSTWILPLLLGLIVTRAVLRSLGTGDYGIYALAFGFISYSFNFNVGRAVTKYLATFRASGETEKIRDVISATLAATVLVAAIGSLIIFVLSNWLVVDVFSIEPVSQAKALLALRVSAGTILLLMIGQVAIAVLQGLHRFDVFSKIQITSSIVSAVGNLVLVYQGYGLVALLYWNLVSTGFMCFLAYVSARSLLPEFLSSIKFSGEAMRLVAKYSSGVVAYQIVANGFFLFERGWITAKLGTESLTYYAIPMSLGIYFHGFVASISMVLFPLASELDRKPERLLKLYRAATKSVLFVVVIGVTMLVSTGKLFLTLWLGADLAEHSATILTIQAFAFGLAALTIVSFQTAEGIGRPAFNFRTMGLGVLVALPLIFWFTKPLGDIGVALGRLIVFLVPALAILRLEYKYLGGVQGKFWIRNIGWFGFAAVVTYSVSVFMTALLPESLVALVLIGAAGGLIYLFCLYIAGALTDEDRSMVRKLIASRA